MFTRNKRFKLERNVVRDVFREAMDVGYGCKVDQLDCSISFHRENTDKSIEWVIDLLNSADCVK